jgi:biotin transport system substrate-specific component
MTSDARTSGTAAGLARIVVFAALIAVLGLFPGIPVGAVAVPIVLQNMGPVLAGVLLGPRAATAATALFLALVALGLPLLTGGRGGLAPFVAPGAGYLVGYLLSALVSGLVASRLARRGPPRFAGLLVAVLLGLFVDYVPGIAVYALAVASLPTAAVLSLAFVPGDLVKAVVVALVASLVHRALPDLAHRR